MCCLHDDLGGFAKVKLGVHKLTGEKVQNTSLKQDNYHDWFLIETWLRSLVNSNIHIHSCRWLSRS